MADAEFLIVNAKACAEALRALLPVRLDNTDDRVRTRALKELARALTPVSEEGEAIPCSEQEATWIRNKPDEADREAALEELKRPEVVETVDAIEEAAKLRAEIDAVDIALRECKDFSLVRVGLRHRDNVRSVVCQVSRLYRALLGQDAEVVEQCALAAHEDALALERSAGAHRPDECPQKTPHPTVGGPPLGEDCVKCFASLRRWDELMETEKDLRRCGVRRALQSIAKTLGVVGKPGEETDEEAATEELGELAERAHYAQQTVIQLRRENEQLRADSDAVIEVLAECNKAALLPAGIRRRDVPKVLFEELKRIRRALFGWDEGVIEVLAAYVGSGDEAPLAILEQITRALGLREPLK